MSAYPFPGGTDTNSGPSEVDRLSAELAAAHAIHAQDVSDLDRCRAELAEQKDITNDWRETAERIAAQRDEYRKMALGDKPPAWTLP